MDDSVTVHQRNLQLLMVEIYKTKYNLNPSFIKQIFEEKEMPYNLRCSDKLRLPKAKTICLGIDTIRFMGKKVWETLPAELKNSGSLQVFKRVIKAHKCHPATADYAKYLIPI